MARYCWENSHEDPPCTSAFDCARDLWDILDDLDTATDALEGPEFDAYLREALRRRFRHAEPWARPDGELELDYRYWKHVR